MLLDRNTELIIEERPQQRGGIKYLVSQKENITSIAFLPGGIHKENYLIHGTILTIYKESYHLIKDFRKHLIKGFKKYQEYYIGPESLTLYGTVRFITIHVNQDPIYDFEF